MQPRSYAITALVAAFSGAAVSLLFFLCFSHPTGQQGQAREEKPPPPEHAAAKLAPITSEEGVALICYECFPQEEEVEVFFRRPFASPPHLSFPDDLPWGCRPVDQTASSFKLRAKTIEGVSYVQPVKVKWRAEGLAK